MSEIWQITVPYLWCHFTQSQPQFLAQNYTVQLLITRSGRGCFFRACERKAIKERKSAMKKEGEKGKAPSAKEKSASSRFPRLCSAQHWKPEGCVFVRKPMGVCVWGCVCGVSVYKQTHERERKPGARKETGSAKGFQERERKPGARKSQERERKSVKLRLKKERQHERFRPGA